MHAGKIDIPCAELSLFLLSIAFKTLLFPLYKSTDFEVHRNWLAITHSLPVSQWYFEATSEWTLDYPPLFAYMERIFAFFASYADPGMLDIKSLDYSSWATVVYQRSTVLLSDGMLFIAVSSLLRRHISEPRKRLAALSLVAFNPGLIVVDNIHFQYNGAVFALLIFSIRLFQSNCITVGSCVFLGSILLKHINLYVAPVMACAALCWVSSGTSVSDKVGRFSRLAASSLCIVLAILWPFLNATQLTQMLSRMFPFGRGLCHAYWAPNVWALYSALDVFLSKVLGSSSSTGASMTTGLVGEGAGTALLPSVSPKVTVALTLLALLPACRQALRTGSENLLSLVSRAALASFLFGYHVHEKAILMATLPALINSAVTNDSGWMMWQRSLCLVAHISLFPLLPGTTLWLFQTALTVGFAALGRPKQHVSLVWTVCQYACALVLAMDVLLPIFLPHLPFLPLMARSSICSVALLMLWLQAECQTIV